MRSLRVPLQSGWQEDVCAGGDLFVVCVSVVCLPPRSLRPMPIGGVVGGLISLFFTTHAEKRCQTQNVLQLCRYLQQ